MKIIFLDILRAMSKVFITLHLIASNNKQSQMSDATRKSYMGLFVIRTRCILMAYRNWYYSTPTHSILVYFLANHHFFPIIFLWLTEKGPRPKWTIYKHESNKNKECLFIILSDVYLLPIYCLPF